MIVDMYGAYLSDWVFRHPEELAPQSHVLLYYTLFVYIPGPILLPLGVLMSVEKREVLRCWLIIAFGL
jgi:hypothetical protein